MAETCLPDTPLGPVTLEARDGRLVALHWRLGGTDADPLLRRGLDWLAAYFDGHGGPLPDDLALAWGTGLHEKVRRAMAAIPLGRTRSYGEIARDLGVPAQAVGQACGANPLPILIPCHRVLGAKGLGGFSAKGGVETKVWLLRHDGAAGLLI
jgi:methylated-DNA-[protein]-cysteine S-methyltransferase